MRAPPAPPSVAAAGGLRILLLGLPLAGVLLHHDGHAIEQAVLSRADAVGRRRLTRRLGAERVRLRAEANDAWIVQTAERLRPDLVVSWFWTTRVPMAAVRAARLGGFGVHPSLLPRHRGADPYFAALDAGDAETGVTAHRLEADYDTGAILGSRRLAIDPSWNAWRLARALDRPSLALLRDTVARFARGEPVDEREQDAALATEAPAPDDDACALRFGWTTERLLCRIRALAPAPGAFTEIGDTMVAVHAARAAASFPRVLAPGEAAVVAGRAVVRTADGALELLEGEIDDEPADAKAFADLVARTQGLVVG